MSGEGVFTIPYGPVRSGVFESVEYLVETSGEEIPHLRTRVYHKHRGLDRRFGDLDVDDAVLLAERVEGTNSVAHALCLLPGARIPRRGRALPTGRSWSASCTPSWNGSPPTWTRWSATPKAPGRPSATPG